MKQWSIVGALVCAGLVGCSQSKPTYTHASGTVALSSDGSIVYAVDTDNNAVMLANAKDGTLIGQVAVGKSPSRITVGPDDRIYVSNTGERTVSVLARNAQGQVSESKRIAVDVEPAGLSLTNDGSQLLVVSATGLNDPTQGTLTAIDTTTLNTAWKVNVGEEPRGVAVVNNKAYVTNLKQGKVTTVDLQLQAATGSLDLNNLDSPDPVSNPDARTAGAATEITPSPSGNRLYVTHTWQKSGSITGSGSADVAEGQGGGTYGGGGETTTSCNPGSIVLAGLGTIDVATNTSKADSFVCGANGINPGLPSSGSSSTPSAAPDFPRSTFAGSSTTNAFQGPSAAVVDATGNWIYVANKLSNNVAVLPTSRSSTDPDPLVTTVGAGPDGLALSNDGMHLYVYSQLDHSLSILTNPSPNTVGGALQVTSTTTLAADTLPADQVLGRKMFFSAVDPRMTAPTTSLACATCHLGGREDGHVWVFPDGKRQTPSLAGRAIAHTAPYHWAAIFPVLNDFFTETIVGRMGGAGSRSDGALGLNETDSANLAAFIEGMPAADNPLQNRPDLTATLAAGRQAFEKATCNTCHAGDVLTDNQNHNVGTLHQDEDLLEIINSAGIGTDPNDPQDPWGPLTFVNTPSLLGLGRTAPYLHDGSLPSVSARIAQAETANPIGERHGDTSQLSPTEIAALQQYLLSL